MSWTVFIDLDDTLIDTSERHYRVYKEALISIQAAEILSKKEFWDQKRMGIKTADLLPATSTPDFIQRFMTEWSKRIETKKYLKYDHILPESLDVISSLKNNYDLILVTLRKNKKNLFWELDNFGLAKYFTEILYGPPLLRNKISLAEKYRKAHSRENNFIIVGDSEIDVSTGKEMGMLTIAVTYGIRSKDFLEKLKPDFCVNNLQEILKILKEISDTS